MATFLDALGVLKNFDAVFVFLFVYVLIFGLLSYVKFLGENKAINAIIALSVSILFITSNTLLRAMSYIAPWFVMLVLFSMLIIMMFRFMGATEENIINVVSNHPIIMTFTFAFISAIVILSFGQVFKENVEENATVSTSFPAKVGLILQHPAVLGVIAILLIAAWAIKFLAEK